MKLHSSPATKEEWENCVMPEAPYCYGCDFGIVVYPEEPFTDFYETYCSCTPKKKEAWLTKNGEAWKKHCEKNGLI